MDRTLKLRTYAEAAKSNPVKEKSAKELTVLIEEERFKSLDLAKTIMQLRENLQQEQDKSAMLKARLTKLDSVEENQLIRKNAELEEEKKKSQEYLQEIEQLKESLKQELGKSSQMAKKMVGLEARVNKLDSVEESQLVKKNAELEEEKKKSLEYVKTIEQLRDSHKHELEKSAQVLNKMAELEAKVNKMDSVEQNQLIKKNTLLEDEKKKSLEYAKLIDQLRESIKVDQKQSADMAKRIVKLEAKIQELKGVLGKIASIATEGKAG